MNGTYIRETTLISWPSLRTERSDATNGAPGLSSKEADRTPSSTGSSGAPSGRLVGPILAPQSPTERGERWRNRSHRAEDPAAWPGDLKGGEEEKEEEEWTEEVGAICVFLMWTSEVRQTPYSKEVGA